MHLRTGLKKKQNKASKFGFINDKSIAHITTKTIYKKGTSYYNKKSNIISVAYGDVDPYDVLYDDHGRCIRFTFAKDADGFSYVTNIYDDGAMQCNCSRNRMCVHEVAGLLYVRDNLEEILAQKPVSLPSLRREAEEMEDRAEEADLLRPRDPAAEFAVWLREEKFKKTAAIRRLKEEINFISSTLTSAELSKKPRARIKAAKKVLDLYLDYLYTIMLEHANTRQKRLAYLKFLKSGYTGMHETAEAKDSYKKYLARLYKLDSEWRKYITSSLTSKIFDSDYDDDDYALGRPIYADDVLPYTGMLEAVGKDASKIFEMYYEDSATICHEYALYLERINKPDKAKRVKMRCRKWFGKETRAPQDYY